MTFCFCKKSETADILVSEFYTKVVELNGVSHCRYCQFPYHKTTADDVIVQELKPNKSVRNISNQFPPKDSRKIPQSDLLFSVFFLAFCGKSCKKSGCSAQTVVPSARAHCSVSTSDGRVHQYGVHES